MDTTVIYNKNSETVKLCVFMFSLHFPEKIKPKHKGTKSCYEST